jgi:hypothetical protein
VLDRLLATFTLETVLRDVVLVMLVAPVHSRVARPLIEGLRNATVARDESLRELVPLRLTPFDDVARTAISARHGDDGATT